MQQCNSCPHQQAQTRPYDGGSEREGRTQSATQGEEGKRGEGGKGKGGEVDKSFHSWEEADQQGVDT